MWGLPCDTRCELLSVLCNDLPVFDTLCKRVMSFLNVCINSDCNIVRYVSKYAITRGLMHSPRGRNALYCKLRYGVDVSTMSSLKFSPVNHIWCHYLSNVSPELITKVGVLMDMVMLRENRSEGDFILSNEEIELVIHTSCTD